VFGTTKPAFSTRRSHSLIYKVLTRITCKPVPFHHPTPSQSREGCLPPTHPPTMPPTAQSRSKFPPSQSTTFLPPLPRYHKPFHLPVCTVRINKNNQLTKLITVPPKTLSPPTLPLRTHLPLPLSPNSRSSLLPASRPTPPIQRLIIHTITSP
jgi:hypothetical protein